MKNIKAIISSDSLLISLLSCELWFVILFKWSKRDIRNLVIYLKVLKIDVGLTMLASLSSTELKHKIYSQITNHSFCKIDNSVCDINSLGILMCVGY